MSREFGVWSGACGSSTVVAHRLGSPTARAAVLFIPLLPLADALKS